MRTRPVAFVPPALAASPGPRKARNSATNGALVNGERFGNLLLAQASQKSSQQISLRLCELGFQRLNQIAD